MIIAAVLSSVRFLNPQNTNLTIPLTIAINYLYTIVPFTAYYLLFNGSKKLRKLLGENFPAGIPKSKIFILIIAKGSAKLNMIETV
jgi:hypothetical protein